MKKLVIVIAIMMLALCGCTAPSGADTTSNSKHSSSKTSAPTVDDAELRAMLSQLPTDLEENEMTDELLAYSKKATECYSLLRDDNITQGKVDEAVKELERLRDAALFPGKALEESGKVEDRTNFNDFVQSIDDMRGRLFNIEGIVTSVDGGFRGSAYRVYVYWDESCTQGEVAEVVIPYDRYSESVSNHFDGVCECIGINDSGMPVFECVSYTV